jgi:hypothetical protein
MAEEVEPDIESTTNGEDEDSVLDKENDQNDEAQMSTIQWRLWMRL